MSEKEQEVQTVLISTLSTEDLSSFYIYGEIGEEICLAFNQFMLKNEMLAPNAPITIYLNTYGGELFSAWSMVDTIMNSKLDITIVAQGKICSAGTLIFIAGKKRLMQRHCYWMSHQFSDILEGKFHEMKAMSEFNDIMHDDLVKYYKKQTKMKIKDITDKVLGNTDFWLTAEQCLDLGICDELI